MTKLLGQPWYPSATDGVLVSVGKGRVRPMLRVVAPSGLLVIGILVIGSAPILLPIGLLVAIGVIAIQTRPAARPPTKGAAVVGGVVGYPVSCTLIYLVLQNTDVGILGFAIFALAALVFGALVGRQWMLVMPVVLAAALLTIGYLNDPSCSSCGEDTRSYAVAMAALLYVGPAILMIEVGILIDNLRRRGASHSRI